MQHLSFYWKLLRESVTRFLDNHGFTQAGAIAYYTIFSLPPILLVVLEIATTAYREQQVKTAIFDEIGDLVGQDGASQISATIDQIGIFDTSWWSTAIGIGILLFTATTVFITMQDALNQIFGVKPKPKGLGILKMLRDRLLSFAMVMAIAFILMVSLFIDALLTVFSQYLDELIGQVSTWIIVVFSAIIPLLTIAVLFSLIFRFLPDARIPWRHVFFGSGITALLFAGGKYLISFYIGNSQVANFYDAAGSIMVILLWVFYAAIIFLFGATLMVSRMRAMGEDIHPMDYAVLDEPNGSV